MDVSLTNSLTTMHQATLPLSRRLPHAYMQVVLILICS
jgi:hypothetical protein